MTELTVQQEAEAIATRSYGREAWNSKTRTSNPYPPGTFRAYCWDAGYRQDARNIRELHRDWQTKEQPK
jgi:hypothetical protein